MREEIKNKDSIIRRKAKNIGFTIKKSKSIFIISIKIMNEDNKDYVCSD